MRRFLLGFLSLMICVAEAAHAASVVARRTIPARSVLGLDDLAIVETDIRGAASSVESVLGLETSHAVFAGRPVLQSYLSAPAIIERNQIVALKYQSRGLVIETEGRALQRGGFKDRISVMNLTSRATVIGEILADGSILVRD